MKKQRSSNFELLRVFAMLMIIIFHLTLHWSKEQVISGALQAQFHNGYFSCPIFYKRLLLINTAMPMGTVGNGIFMMISGYFLSNREQIDLIKVSKKLLFQLGYVSITIIFASFFIYNIVNHKHERYFTLEKYTVFNSSTWWFIGYYYVVIVIAALLLNSYMIKAEQRKALTLLIVIFSIVEIGWSGGLLDALGSGFRTTGIGIFLYLLGGYIKKYDPFKNVNKIVFFIIIVLSNIINYISSYNETTNSIQTYIKNGSTDTFYQPIYMPTNYDIIIILLAVSIFEIFKDIKIPNSRIINYLGSSTFIVYLIHENGFFQSIYTQTDCITVLYKHPYQYIILILKWTFICFSVGLFAYIIFDLGSKLIKYIIDGHNAKLLEA